MSRRLSGSPFTVSFSTRNALVPVWMSQHVAMAAGIDGVDVDCTSPLGGWLAGRWGAVDQQQLPVRSMWFSADAIRSARVRRTIEAVLERGTAQPPQLVFLLASGGSVRDLARTHEVSRTEFRDQPFAVGLPAAALRGGRPHLVLLGAIRRFAEEWELDVAIDLSGRFDPTWEAEAAVARLGDRLRVLRLPSSGPSRAAVGRDRVACRALCAALDRERPLDIALTSTAPMPFPITPRAAASSAARAVDYIADRVALHARALREGIDRFEGSPSSRQR
ncbi:MAG TPA: hypothetical protein VJ777_14295 [Mycobacterium sp.]|nr:hypothetical protein [Mycobacterium sp.]